MLEYFGLRPVASTDLLNWRPPTQSRPDILHMTAFSDAARPPPLAITYCPVGTLRPDPRNARTHPKQQINQIVASIRQFGFVNPILADPDGRIIAGHGRLMAAKAIGLADVPTIYIPGLSETQKRALRIADNKIALGAGWDLDVLKMELARVGNLGSRLRSLRDRFLDRRIG